MEVASLLMQVNRDIAFSVLDLVPIVRGGTAAQAFRNALDLAQNAERWGYRRYWVAEHHNIPGIASTATAVVIGHIAGGTSKIRVGSGGIMLPNHAPLIIAEQFGTLETLHPGRIDLGIGRAPGGDAATSRALRRNMGASVETFPQDLLELQAYFQSGTPRNGVRAIPGQGLNIPIYVLGSSTYGAQLAAELGLPFAFASHFAPALLLTALDIYRSRFKASHVLEQPYAIVGVNVIAAETDREAQYLFTSLQQQFLNLIRGHPREMPPPVEQLDWNPAEQAHVAQMTRCSVVGSPSTVRQGIEAILDETGADEIITTAQIFDPGARLRSFEIGAQVFHEINRSHSPLVV